MPEIVPLSLKQGKKQLIEGLAFPPMDIA
jgi:hypothetical protein